jgi:hypothetical protein
MTNKEKLIEKAKALGIKTEGLTEPQLKAEIKKVGAEKFAELTVAVSDAKTEFEALKEDATDADKALAQEKIDLAEQALADFTGKPLEKKAVSEPGTIELNGSVYAFKKNAPERFNFLGVNRTQEEWLKDKDAMELLISGNSSFVKPLKK